VVPYNSRANKGTPMTIQQSIEQLSSAVVTNGDSIIKILELINKQNNQIDYQSAQINKLQKELQELKSKLQ
jgi:septal ring factor EnvC (AmiA/AmiB activator)